jgi:hypothetical protein
MYYYYYVQKIYKRHIIKRFFKVLCFPQAKIVMRKWTNIIHTLKEQDGTMKGESKLWVCSLRSYSVGSMALAIFENVIVYFVHFLNNVEV